MLYRRERRAVPWLVAVATAVLVLPLGFWMGRRSASEPTLSDVLNPSVDLIRELDGTLDIVLLEYNRVGAGSKASLEAVINASNLGEEHLRNAVLLRTLYPKVYDQAFDTLKKLQVALAEQMSISQVEDLVKQLRTELNNLRPLLSTF